MPRPSRTSLRAVLLLPGALVGVTFVSASAEAKPPGATIFCQVYPNAPACAGGEVACTTCHTAPPARNPFGLSIEKGLAVGAPRPLSDQAYADALPAALRAAEAADPDGDGVASLDEILGGSNPADGQSVPVAQPCVDPGRGGASGGGERSWNVCGYDERYAYRKVLVDFCGRSPTYDEEATFERSTARRQEIHVALTTCLGSEHWRGRRGAVWNLAAPKIRPLQSIKAGDDQGPVPLADYDDDFALFVYTQIDDRDARDLLRAKYYVSATKTAPTVYAPFERTAVEDARARPGFANFQTIDPPQRAGMLTTRYFRVVNTMFTPVPRTTAAQAYRAYLGLDIALMQGLQPGMEQEPQDFDTKGVRASGCINCHRTLDPLTYPFSRYEALDRDAKTGTVYRSQYRPDRMDRFVATENPRITQVPEAGSIFGKPVANLLEWAQVAAESDDFAKKLVLDYWRLVFQDDPRPEDTAEVTRLWTRLRNDHGYSVQKMLHDLVDTEAYGVP